MLLWSHTEWPGRVGHGQLRDGGHGARQALWLAAQEPVEDGALLGQGGELDLRRHLADRVAQLLGPEGRIEGAHELADLSLRLGVGATRLDWDRLGAAHLRCDHLGGWRHLVDGRIDSDPPLQVLERPVKAALGGVECR